MTSSNIPSYSLREIVDRFGGEIVGNPEVRVASVASLQNAGPGAISFLSNERYFQQLRTTEAAAVIVAHAAREATQAPRIVCANPHVYFAQVSRLLNPLRTPSPGIHPTAVVHPSARIDPSAEIGACAVIEKGSEVGARTAIGPGTSLGENVRVGCDSRLYAQVTVYDGCVLGDRVIAHSGVVIGADGFGIAFDDERWVKVPQIGGVRIGNDVEIGASTTIDRGALDDTVIEEGVKLDNQIQIAHNVRVGAHTVIAACSGIAGSAQIGRYCLIAGGVGIAEHVHVADHVQITAYTCVIKSIESPGAYSGVYPFQANRQWRRNAAQLRHLDDLARRVATLEDKLAELIRSRS